MIQKCFWIPNGSLNTIFEKKTMQNILIFDDNQLMLNALEQYIKLVPKMADYQFTGSCRYGEIAVTSQYRNADIILFGIFRRFGIKMRAEGVPALTNRIRFGKKGLIVGFAFPEIKDNPLYWDMTSEYTLADKLAGLNAADDFSAALNELQTYFQKDIFPVDGH